MKVLRDARLTECCGQHYCDSCLTQWLQKQKTCPHCRKEDFQSILNKEKIREINELRIRGIRCTNCEKGCEWVGEQGALKGHLVSDKGCGYEIVRCTNYAFTSSGFTSTKQRCEVVMERRALTAHMQNKCKYRLYKCEYCDYTDTFDAIAGSGEVTMKQRRTLALLFGRKGIHYAECDHYPLPCPNECGQKNIKRKDMKKTHGICPLEPLNCPFKDAGCTDKICRRDMENHIESSTQKHLLMVFKSYQEVMKLNQELKARVGKLEKK